MLHGLTRFRIVWFALLFLAASAPPFLLLIAATPVPSARDDDVDTPHDPRLSGGDTTIFDASSAAFEAPAPNLSDDELILHTDGDLAFDQSFVSAPAAFSGGLGPIFNNNACASCHPRNGRGEPAEPDNQRPPTLFLRLSLPGIDAITGGPLPVPGFGLQLQHKSLFGVRAEGEVGVVYTEIVASFSDGVEVSLRKPEFSIVDPYLELPGDVLLSPRMALPVFGRGLLEAIDAATLLGVADEDDADGDGISGKPNWVWDAQAQVQVIGRFGWKANNPTLLQQNAGAYTQDMGVTNPYFPEESSAGQLQVDGRADEPEIAQDILDASVFYVQTLAVPARRNLDDPRVQRGEAIFAEAHCAACHIPTVQTGRLDGVAAVSHQIIHPYTDLLLHDMGDGLADGRPDFAASGREWRTPPLWGIGLTERVNGHTFFLHDGRARNLLEAIMWHGGEAEAAREHVRQLSQSDRAALVAFLQSL
jgi:CxxC motif-containing protein (DUF1111 family)